MSGINFIFVDNVENFSVDNDHDYESVVMTDNISNNIITCNYCDIELASVSKLQTHYKEYHSVDLDGNPYFTHEELDNEIINVKFSKPSVEKTLKHKVEMGIEEQEIEKVTKCQKAVFHACVMLFSK